MLAIEVDYYYRELIQSAIIQLILSNIESFCQLKVYYQTYRDISLAHVETNDGSKIISS